MTIFAHQPAHQSWSGIGRWVYRLRKNWLLPQASLLGTPRCMRRIDGLFLGALRMG